MIRSNWTQNEILKILNLPLIELILKAQKIHKKYFPKKDVQLASLLSIKTGSCPENCKYCPQSAHYNTGIKKEALISVKEVLKKAKKAKNSGASRFCMGAAWREVKDGSEFNKVIKMVEGIKKIGMESCVTLGMLNQKQANKLAKAGLKAYNHNIDTSPNFYKKIITTRTFQERIDTIKRVRKAGITVCCGGIIGMGEKIKDRAEMLKVLSNFKPHPESVPINALVPSEGTPLANRKKINSIELVKMCATARIVMPKSRVRLSAGRKDLTNEAQILCFMAGANSIFYGDKLLTTGNNDTSADISLLKSAGLPLTQA
ncbi:MAG: Biotin synthase [Alphaproteobacteria bacterium MarineAlpha6_Bin6]|nr:MAG: Biotin synthase [Alphaproteobacteria bacterium MarineAlpha6_Bin6]PPR32542.1 MAG: Biotin synthase [Alphaproteobacteria bacterium MarineAlpha6_Bin5]|tara:strand:- start:99 stop:1046 length:948 start_codon:yes stop_codon:yes gene_type:complete